MGPRKVNPNLTIRAIKNGVRDNLPGITKLDPRKNPTKVKIYEPICFSRILLILKTKLDYQIFQIQDFLQKFPSSVHPIDWMRL